MKLYQPQVLLVPSTDGQFYLHATTFFNTINFKSKGHKIKKRLSKDGSLKVDLYASMINGFPQEVLEMECINPVVHHVDLGERIQLTEEGELNNPIEVTVYIISSKSSTSRSGGRRRKAGSAKVKSPSTGSHTKPKPNNN